MPLNPSSSFVGRESELGELRRGLSEALTSAQGRLFLVAGEPGIGKTRLADELATAARSAGAMVLWGRCWESAGAPAYWPWTQIIRAYAREAQATTEAAHLLSELAPSGDPRSGRDQTVANPSPGDDFEQARFALFDSMTTLLQNAATRQPLVMILDDLHGADIPSLLMLRFMARELRNSAWVVVGTYRANEAARDAQRGPLLAEIAREGRLIALHGLSRADVDRYILSLDLKAAGPSIVDAVYTTTEGNPLFLTEVLNLLAQAPPTAGGPTRIVIPDQLRATIRRRMEPLSDGAKQALSAASVIGREFDLAILEHALGTSVADVRVLDLLDEAMRLGLVSQHTSAVARYTFSHALIRETLYDDLGATAQAQMHRRIGTAIEAVRGADLAPYLTEVAHHFLRAAVDGNVDEAVRYAERVGQRAVSLLAYEEAAKHYKQALDALNLRLGGAAPGDAQLACELLLKLGDAQWGAGELTTMRETFQRAAEAGRHIPGAGPALVARAALGLGGRQQRSHAWYDDDLVRLLEEALVAMDTSDNALRARTMARLAYALYLVPGSYERRQRLSRDAVEMARRVGDEVTLHWTLNDRRWALWGPSTSDDRLVTTNELLQRAERLGDRELAMVEHTWRLVELLERADIAGVDAEIARIRHLSHELQRPWFLSYAWRFEAMQAMTEGRFQDSERCAEQALANAQRVRNEEAVLIYSTLLLTLRMLQGRLGELETGIRAFAANYPSVPIWQSVLAFVHAELGRDEQARGEFEHMASQDFRNLPRDYLMLPAAAYLSEVCLFLGDGERAAQLYEVLEPYAQRLIVIGFGVASLGCVSRYLGLLAETMHDWPQAAEHYETALAVNARMRARPALAQTQVDYGRLLKRAPAGSVTRRNEAEADDLLEAAAQTATALGMGALQKRIAALRETLVAAPAVSSTQAAVTAAPEPRPERSFRRQGDYWTLQFESSPFQLPDLLGLRYVAHLLRHPGQEFHVTDLVDLGDKTTKNAGADVTEYASIRADLGDAGPVLDAQAKQSYKTRLRDLREELAEAESLNDMGKIDVLRAEMDALTQELAGAVGLGGRSRRAASHSERARVSVTKRIGIALKRIRAHDPALARYLSLNLKTGAFCSYNPDPTRAVEWKL